MRVAIFPPTQNLDYMKTVGNLGELELHSFIDTVNPVYKNIRVLNNNNYRAVSRLIKTLGAHLTCGINVHKAME